MALITVILIFTVFSVLGLVIFSSIMTNMKQITKTEEKVQATDLAEMGVTYYKSAIQNKIINLNTLGSGSIDDYFSALNGQLDDIEIKKQISQDGVSFEIQPIDNMSNYGITNPNQLTNNITTFLDLTKDKIGVLIKSKGTTIGETRDLILYLTYDIRVNPEGIFSVIPPTSTADSLKCGSTLSTSSYSGFDCIYEGDQKIGTLDSISDSTIYIAGDLDITNKINSIDGGNIHIEGDLSIDNVLNNFKKSSIIEVEGSAEINKIDTTNQSIRLTVGRDLDVNYLHNLKDSLIEVFGNAVIGNFPTPTNSDILNIQNTTIVIHGDASLPPGYSTFQESTSKICVFGNLLTGLNNEKVYVKGESNFDTQCGNLYGGDAKYILRPEPEESVEYR